MANGGANEIDFCYNVRLGTGCLLFAYRWSFFRTISAFWVVIVAGGDVNSDGELADISLMLCC